MSVAESQALAGTGEIGSFYSLHFEPPYKQARHYEGWTSRSVAARLAEHMAGKGSPLVKAAVEAGCTVVVANVVHGVDRHFERAMKEGKNAPRRCPVCQGKASLMDCVAAHHG